jgi:hypothetical protein
MDKTEQLYKKANKPIIIIVWPRIGNIKEDESINHAGKVLISDKC